MEPFVGRKIVGDLTDERALHILESAIVALVHVLPAPVPVPAPAPGAGG